MCEKVAVILAESSSALTVSYYHYYIIKTQYSFSSVLFDVMFLTVTVTNVVRLYLGFPLTQQTVGAALALLETLCTVCSLILYLLFI